MVLYRDIASGCARVEWERLGFIPEEPAIVEFDIRVDMLVVQPDVECVTYE